MKMAGETGSSGAQRRPRMSPAISRNATASAFSLSRATTCRDGLWTVSQSSMSAASSSWSRSLSIRRLMRSVVIRTVAPFKASLYETAHQITTTTSDWREQVRSRVMASSWSGLTQRQESQIPPFAEVNPGWNPVGGGMESVRVSSTVTTDWSCTRTG